jgi:L-fucose isomerase-like protein
MTVSVKLGFVPSYRTRWTDWTERMRSESIQALSDISGVQVVAPRVAPPDAGADPASGATTYGAVRTLDEAEIVADYFLRERVDCLVLCPLDFGDERSAAKIAERLGVPVLLYATKEPPATTGASLARVSDSYCGNLSMAAGLRRRRLPFLFAGLFFPEEPGLRAEVDAFVRAVAVVKGLRHARVGQVGVRPPTFEAVAYDEIAMARKFGQNVIFANLDDLLSEARRFPDDDPAVQEIVADTRRSVATVAVADDYLLSAAKLEAALAAFWERSGLSALTMQCWPSVQLEYGISLCALFGRLTGRRLLTACEADVLGALSMVTQYQAALGEDLPHFIDWTIRHRENPNRLLAWHCGNAPVCLARDPGETALRSRRDMTGAEPAATGEPTAGLCQFQVKPGPVTFCRLAEYDGEWKMLIARGRIVPSEETLAGTWAWVEVNDHDLLYRTLVEHGFIHHASMIHGNQAPVLTRACQLLDITPIIVE